MTELLNSVIIFVQGLGQWGVILASILLFFESIVPMIPLLVFVTIEYMLLGPVLGFIVSWVFTVLGCVASYLIFRNGFGDKFDNLTENKELIRKYKRMFRHISTGKLILIVAFPFTPAFVVNIAAGLVKMDFKKYLIALLFGKISLVIYSAYVGTSVVESINNPIILVKIVALIGGVYLLYLVAKKIFKIG